MKSLPRITIIMLLFLFVGISCKKDMKNDDPVVPEVPEQTPDLSTKVNSSVTGFVTNQNNEPIAGASVKAGAISTTTDDYGYFDLKNAMVVKTAAVVTVEYPGYFKGIKTFVATEGKTAFFRIKLLPKLIAGTIQSGSGGSVLLTSGLSIALPADGVKTASTGTAYSGAVNVAVQWIDPTSTELNNIMPGDLRGINSGGFLRLLTTYGMAAVELTGSGGELLQIADGKKATITMPLPASISGTAPSSIPLWYFDETAGLWKEEGSAVKTGNNYIGEVTHFSFWNCDIPNSYVLFNAIVTNIGNVPMAFVPIKISEIANPQNAAWGYTDLNGFVTGAIPNNAQLKLEIFGDQVCATPVYSQNFSTGATNYSAGTIIIPSSNAFVAQFSGTVTDCNNNPVTNGYLRIKFNNQYIHYVLDNTGSYNYSTVICASPIPISLFAVDITSSHMSALINSSLSNGTNLIANIQTCDTVRYGYDGRYELSGYHNRDPYTFPYINIPMELWSVSASAAAFYWPEKSDFGHPIGIAPGQTNWYGNTIAPVIVFDTLSNLVTDVYNSAGAPPITMFTGAGAGISRCDPTTRTIYVYWNYNSNPLRAFFDTLVYTGPR